jgi:hypothetical protein
MAASDFLKKALADAITGGDLYAPYFQEASLGTCNTIIGVHRSFATAAPDMAAVTALKERLVAFREKATVVPKLPRAVTEMHLQKLIVQCNKQALAETAAASSVTPLGILPSAKVVPSMAKPVAGATAPVAAATPTAADLGFQQYEVAQLVHNHEYAASLRTRYEVIGKLTTGFMEGRPVAYKLGDFAKEYAVSTAKEETYEAFGQTWKAAEGATKTVKIFSVDDAFKQATARAEAYAVAGAFDAPDAASKRGAAAPKVWPGSLTRYVDTTGAKMVARALDCYASVEGQSVEVKALRTFYDRNPHVQLAQLLAVDTAVEARIADEQLRGHTRDSAVQQACVKSPELYAVPSRAEPKADTPGGGEAGDDEARGNKRGRNRSKDEIIESAKRRIQQFEQQVQNLKSGRGKGGGGGQWQGGGGQWQGGGGQWQGGGGGQWQGGGGKGGGGKGAGSPGPPSGVNCPPNVCRDYNFKVQGCGNSNCKFQHVCAQCGRNHPFRGNH